jgi:hypothetical protein
MSTATDKVCFVSLLGLLKEDCCQVSFCDC